jgi:hypothetical protein
MGTFTTTTIESNGTEKDFFALIYATIKSIDENITMNLTQWDSEENDYVTINNAIPSDIVYTMWKYVNYDFILDSTNNAILRFQTNNSHKGWYEKVSSNCYNLGFYCGNQTLAVSENMNSATWRNDNQVLAFIYPSEQGEGFADVGVNDRVARKIIFSKYVSDNICIYWFAPYNVSDWRSSMFSFTKFKDTNGNWKWAAGITGPDIFGLGTICDATGENVYDFTNMFSYEARTGYLDFISHTSFLSGGTKAFSSSDIYDCTTVNFGDTLSLKDGANFLAIGSHSMVPLS